LFALHIEMKRLLNRIQFEIHRTYKLDHTESMENIADISESQVPPNEEKDP